MPETPKKKPKLTDSERHKRFLEMAKQVGASDSPKTFEEAFKKLTAKPKGAKSGAPRSRS